MNTSSSSTLSMTGIEYDDFNVLQEQIVYTNIPQTISSHKTFSVLPSSNLLPTDPNDFSNKAYIDSNITVVSTALSAETTARIAQDGVLQTNITTVSNALSAETTARIAQDGVLQTNITAETTARELADIALQNSIGSVDSSVVHINNNETILGSKVFSNNNFLVRDASNNDRITVTANETDIEGNEVGIFTTSQTTGIAITENNIVSLSENITNIGSVFNEYFDTSKELRYGTEFSSTSKMLITDTDTQLNNTEIFINGNTNVKGDFLVEDSDYNDIVKVQARNKTTLTNFNTLIQEPFFVMVGGSVTDGSVGDEIATSNDGVTWTGRSNNVFQSQGMCVAWNGSIWVAGGLGFTGNTIATSTDGITWTGRSSIFLTTLGIAWNGSLWVAVGGGYNDSIATSIDGITWVGQGKTAFSNQGYGVAWNGSLWVAVGDGATHKIITSPDGFNWTGRASLFSVTGRGVAWSAELSLWVAVGEGTVHTIATSIDGINWAGQGNSVLNWAGRAIAWNGSLWVAVGGGTLNSIAYSSNGINWFGAGKTIFTGASPNFNDGNGIAWIGHLGLWYAVGGSATNYGTSPNGINWTLRTGGPFAITTSGIASGATPKLVINNNTTTIVNETIRINGELILTGFANVEAIATFNEPVIAPAVPTQATHLTNRAYVDVRAFDNQVVHLSGAETITGEKTFNAVIVAGAIPTANTHLTNKLYVDTKISNLVDSSPATLDTLNELAAALGDDPNFATTITGLIGAKADDNAVVHKALDETITGNKTFSTNVIASTAPTLTTHLCNKQYVDLKALDTLVVHLAGSETITGAKTFSDNLRVTGAKTININSVSSVTVGDKAILNLFESNNTWGSQISNDAGADIFRISMVDNLVPSDKITISRTATTLTNTTTKIQSGVTDKITVNGTATTIANTTIAINGATTFDTVVSAPSTAPTANTHLTNKLYVDTADTTLQTNINLKANDADVVHLAGLETITGDKTFSTNVIASTAPTLTTHLCNKQYVDLKALDTLVVHLAGSETITGTKTFSSAVIASTAPTLTAHLCNKAYVDLKATDSLVVHLAGSETITGSKTFKNDVFLVENTEGTDKISVDGLTTTLTNNNLHYKSRFYLFMGSGSTSVATSHNALSLTAVSSGFNTNGNSAAWSSELGLWVGVGKALISTGNIESSTDGIAWFARSSLFTTAGYGIVWSPEKALWVAVGEGTNRIATSTNGTTWTARTSPFTTSGRGVVWNGSTQFVAVGTGTFPVATSPDGLTWTGRSGSLSFITEGYGIAYNGSIYVMVGNGSTYVIATSTDGINWNGTLAKSNNIMYGVAWNGSLWVAVGAALVDKIYTSPDGITWTARSSPFDNVVYAVAWTGSQWIAGGDGTTVYAKSDDGITWTARPTPFTTAIYGFGIGADALKKISIDDTLTTLENETITLKASTGVAIAAPLYSGNYSTPLCNFTLSGIPRIYDGTTFQFTMGGIPNVNMLNSTITFRIPFKCRVVGWTLNGDGDTHSACTMYMRISTLAAGGGTIYYGQTGNMAANALQNQSLCMNLNGNVSGWTSVVLTNPIVTIPAGISLCCYATTSVALLSEFNIILWFQQMN